MTRMCDVRRAVKAAGKLPAEAGPPPARPSGRTSAKKVKIQPEMTMKEAPEGLGVQGGSPHPAD